MGSGSCAFGLTSFAVRSSAAHLQGTGDRLKFSWPVSSSGKPGELEVPLDRVIAALEGLLVAGWPGAPDRP